MNAQLIDPALLELGPWEDKPNKVTDDVLKNSMQVDGIQRPMFALRDDGRIVLVDGMRRQRIALAIGIPRVPVMISDLPAGTTIEREGGRLRFILNVKRQDLLPTQRAELIVTLKKQYGMGNLAVAQYLGIDADSVTNWLNILNYVPVIQQAMDADRLSQRAARVFDGMSEKGQNYVWQHHADELCNDSSKDAHKRFRALYHPNKHADFYKDPARIAFRLSGVKKGGAKKMKPRPSFSPDEKSKLLKSYEVRESELQDAKDELKALNYAITAAIPIVATIVRTKKLWSMVPPTMQPELQRFAELYCP